jgi:hypothetical protein
LHGTRKEIREFLRNASADRDPTGNCKGWVQTLNVSGVKIAQNRVSGKVSPRTETSFLIHTGKLVAPLLPLNGLI